MRITVRFVDDIAVMSLDGKFLAGSDGPFLRQKVKELMDAGTQRLVLDFLDVPYIDSTGLGFLAGTRETANLAGVALVLAAVNEHVKRVLDSVQLAQFFVLAKDEAEALAKVKELTVAESYAKGSKAKKRPAAGPE